MADLLEVRDLRTYLHTSHGVVKAVDGVSYSVAPGQTVALVGESGCGKTMSALSIMRLVPKPQGSIVGGEIIFAGRDLLTLKDEEMRRIRGAEIAMIFQEPMSSLNPVLTIGRQITETLEAHSAVSKGEARERALELLRLVGIPDPVQRLSEYPHQFSGGMRQRVMIAIALSCKPKLILADEPTTALDVTIQAQILELVRDLTQKFGVALMIITHNLGVVARYADRVNVMYAGKIIESALMSCMRARLSRAPARARSTRIRVTLIPSGFSAPCRAWTNRARPNSILSKGNLRISGIFPKDAVSCRVAGSQLGSVARRFHRCERREIATALPVGWRKHYNNKQF